MKTNMLDIMISAVQQFLDVINKNTSQLKESENPATFKCANRYSDSWLAADETKCDNNTPPTKE